METLSASPSISDQQVDLTSHYSGQGEGAGVAPSDTQFLPQTVEISVIEFSHASLQRARGEEMTAEGSFF